ncbi:SRPBCC family protein [Iamia majanohamensis]|uniref:SRPBCC family protein n=1 Tax=Iamia majanohamensis TaxID=467976 RepID=A0AAF0BVM0_9ACTN|nr:SRPBCC family protein [Iamia majanohamensis]WCO66910.1 SRPBCC family protein [Iamia majanohamensis]
MTDVVRARTIARPPEEVWDALADFGAIATWADRVDHSSLLRPGAGGGAADVGAERRVQVGRSALLERVVESDRPDALAYDIEGLPPVVRRARNAWSLTSAGDGATAVTLTSTVDCGPRPPQKLVARLVGRRMGKESDSMLAGLARTLEGASRD